MRKTYPAIVIAGLLLSQTLQAQLNELATTGLPGFAGGELIWTDVNSDGRLDIVASGVSDATGTRTCDVYENVDGNGTFMALNVGFPQVSEGAVASGDVDNDGWMDILLMGSDLMGTRYTRLYRNNGNETFTPVNIPLPHLSNGDLAIQDLDNDGLQDLILLGRDAANEPMVRIYRNLGGLTFEELSHTLPDLSDGRFMLTDFNNDGSVDLFVFGRSRSGQSVVRLFWNDKGTFNESTLNFPGLSGGTLRSADLDNDGFYDLFYSGFDQNSPPVWQSIVYRNNSGVTLVSAGSLNRLTDGDAAWGDYDHNGRADIVLTGADFPDQQTILFDNNGGFSNSGIPLPGIISGNLTWADVNNDNRIDLLINGFPTGSSTPGINLYLNDETTTNTSPMAPANLNAMTNGGEVRLTWDPALDNETPSEGLSYSIYIGTAPGARDIVSPAAELGTGFRKKPSYGRWKATEATVSGLADGIYYWSVQSIDASYAGSPFATEGSFVICNRLSIGNDTTICFNTGIDLSMGNASDVVTWFDMADPLISIGNGNNLPLTITTDRSIRVEVQRPLGCTLRDTIDIAVLPLPEADLGEDRSICFGSEITLQEGTVTNEVNWFDGNGQLLQGSSSVFSLDIIQDTTVRVTVIDHQGCQNEDVLQVNSIPLPSTGLPETDFVCFREALTYTSTADSVNWFSAGSGLLEVNSNDIVFSNITRADTLWAEIFNIERCVNYDSVRITVRPLPDADAGTDQLICTSETVILGGDNDPALTVAWSINPGSVFSDEFNPEVNPDNDTEYILTVTDNNGCVDMDTVRVVLNPPSIVDAGQDTSICLNEGTLLGGSPTAQGSDIPYTFEWSPSNGLDNVFSANPQASPQATTEYRLITRTRDCVVDTSFVTVTVDPLPTVTTSPDVTVGAGESVQLTASGGVQYEWFPQEGLSFANIPDPVATPNATTVYTVQVTDANNCSNADSLTVFVSTSIFIPNLFTPNGDGNNDFFRVYGTGLQAFILRIYDQKGNPVFETSDVEFATSVGWDGRIGGVDQPAGSYIWTISGRFFNGEPITVQGKRSGTLRLLR